MTEHVTRADHTHGFLKATRSDA